MKKQKMATKNKTDYFELLKEVHEKISKGEKLLMQSFLIERGFTPLTGTVLISGGIIKNNGSKKVPIYSWETCIPNVNMAQKLYEEVYKRLKRMNAKTKENKEKAESTCCVVTEEETFQTIGSEIIDLETLVGISPLEEQEAILILKHLGYKIMKPVTQWEEI